MFQERFPQTFISIVAMKLYRTSLQGKRQLLIKLQASAWARKVRLSPSSWKTKKGESDGARCRYS